MIISQVSLAYYVLYAVRNYHIGAVEIARFTGMTALSTIIISGIFGFMADRYSQRLILLISCVCSGVAGLFILWFDGLWTVYTAFILSNFSLIGYNLSGGIVIIENVPREKLAMCISVNTLITLTVSAVVVVGSSFVIDWFSFNIIFIVSSIASGCGFLLLYVPGVNRYAAGLYKS